MEKREVRIDDIVFRGERPNSYLTAFYNIVVSKRPELIGEIIFNSCFDLESLCELPDEELKSIKKERDQIINFAKKHVRENKSKFVKNINESFSLDKVFTFFIYKELEGRYSCLLFPKAVDYKNLQFDLCISERLFIEIKRTRSLKNIPNYIDQTKRKLEEFKIDINMLMFFVIPLKEEGCMLHEIGVNYLINALVRCKIPKAESFTFFLKRDNTKEMFDHLIKKINELL